MSIVLRSASGVPEPVRASMTRHVLNLAAACSLLLCLVILSLWIPSYRQGVSLIFSKRAGNATVISFGLGSECGSVGLAVVRVTGGDPNETFDRWSVFETDQSALRPRNLWQRIGFVRAHQAAAFNGLTMTASVIGLPHWLLAGVLAILPVRWFRRRLHCRLARRRHAAGECVACGYNLTGNTSGTCPECGIPIPERTA